MRLLDPEMIEHGERIAVEVLVGVDFVRSGDIGGRVAARGLGDAAVAAREVTHLRLPIGVVGREFMQKENRRAAACFLIIEPDIVACDGIGHWRVPLFLSKSSIAVNAGGSNAAAARRDAESSRQICRRSNNAAARHVLVTSGGSYGPRAPAAQKVAGAELGVLQTKG